MHYTATTINPSIKYRTNYNTQIISRLDLWEKLHLGGKKQAHCKATQKAASQTLLLKEFGNTDFKKKTNNHKYWKSQRIVDVIPLNTSCLYATNWLEQSFKFHGYISELYKIMMLSLRKKNTLKHRFYKTGLKYRISAQK